MVEIAFRHGKAGIFKLAPQGTPTTPTDLSPYITEVQFPEPVDTPETTTFGVAAKVYIVGLPSGTFSLSGIFDVTLDTLMNALIGFDNSGIGVAWEYGPGGSLTGQPKYSQNGTTAGAMVQNYQRTTGVADAVRWTATLVVSGGVTRALY